MIDDNFGRVLKALRDNGLEENTVIILTSDHGEALGDHSM
jgi:arylsulfatase A-like enzyme